MLWPAAGREGPKLSCRCPTSARGWDQRPPPCAEPCAHRLAVQPLHLQVQDAIAHAGDHIRTVFDGFGRFHRGLPLAVAPSQHSEADDADDVGRIKLLQRAGFTQEALDVAGVLP